MKRLLTLIIVLALGAGFLLSAWGRGWLETGWGRLGWATGRQASATQFVPAQTLVFAQLPDLKRTLERWKLSALYEIWREPEIQALWQKPQAKLATESAWFQEAEAIRELEPREAFFAVTGIDPAGQPQMLTGFAYSGGRRRVERWLAGPRAALIKAHPAGKSDLEEYGGASIETFVEKELTVGLALVDHWCLISNNLDLLHQTVDRCRQGSPGNLAESAIFQRATAPLPADHDFLLLAQLKPVQARLEALMAASGQAIGDLSHWKETEAVAFATKLEGAQFRDSLFVLSADGKTETPLGHHALKLSGAKPLLYSSIALPPQMELPPMLALALPAAGALQKELEQKGMKDLGQVFGPELGVLGEWKPNTLTPSVVLALDVRDRQKAQTVLKTLLTDWKMEPVGDQLIYSSGTPGLEWASPAVSLREHFLLIGIGGESLETGWMGAGGAPRLELPGATGASGSYAYLDLRTLFERAYGALRPMVGVAVALAPEVGNYLDAGKLPLTETVSKHLSPITFKQSKIEHGVLVESVGPLTFNQILLSVAASSAASAWSKTAPPGKH